MIRKFTKDFRIIQNADRLAERIFAVITLGFVGFILFASLTGPSSHHKFKSNVFVRLISLPSFDSVYAYHDLGDISSNVLFYIPLGLFLALTVSFRKPRFFSFWFLFGFILSGLIECAQHFVGRVTDPVDMITNTGGFLLGFWLGVFGIKYFGLRPSAVIGINADDQMSTKINTIASMRFFYVVVYFISSLLPLDFSFRPSIIFEKLNSDYYGQTRLIIDPFFHFSRWGHDAQAISGLFLGLLPIGILTGFLAGFRKKLNVVGPIMVCLLLAFLSEFSQLFVASRVSDIVMFPLAILAGILGWLCALAWFMLQDFHDSSLFKGAEQRDRFLFLIIAGYYFLLILAALSPYHFEYSFKAVEQKFLFQSNFIPFKLQFLLHNDNNSFEILRGIAAFIPLGLLFMFCFRIFFPSLKRIFSIVLIGLLSLILALIVECLKVIGVGYYFDITYLILSLIGGVIGSVLFRLFSKVM